MNGDENLVMWLELHDDEIIVNLLLIVYVLTIKHFNWHIFRLIYHLTFVMGLVNSFNWKGVI